MRRHRHLRLSAAPPIPALLIAVVLSPALSAGSARAAFERVPTPPAAAALGGISATSADPVFGNPAGAPLIGPPLVGALAAGVWRARPFGLRELGEAQAALWAARSRWRAGLGVRRFGSAAYAESELRLTVAARPVPALAAGLALRGLAIGGPALPAQRSVAVDAAFRLRVEPGLEIGAVVQGILGGVPGDPERRLARTVVGAARTLGAGLTLHAEATRREDRPLGVLGGVSWRPVSALVLRVGFREEPVTLAWGFGLRFGRLVVSVSASEIEPLGRTVRTGVTLGRPPPPPGASPAASGAAP